MAGAPRKGRWRRKDALGIPRGMLVCAATALRSLLLRGVFLAALPVLCEVAIAQQDLLPPAGAADAAKARAKWRMATLAAARQTLDDLDRLSRLEDPERVLMTEALCDGMRTNVAAHAKRDDSRRLCAELARRLRLEAFDVRIAKAAARVSEQSPLPVRPADV